MNNEMDNQAQGQEQDFTPNLLTLVDEEGQEHAFEIADSAEFEGKNYMALVPIYEEAQDLLDDSGELIILEVKEEDGDEFLEAIEDEALFDRVGAFFVSRLEDIYDFED